MQRRMEEALGLPAVGVVRKLGHTLGTNARNGPVTAGHSRTQSLGH
jgi:hypothetical protein